MARGPVCGAQRAMWKVEKKMGKVKPRPCLASGERTYLLKKFSPRLSTIHEKRTKAATAISRVHHHGVAMVTPWRPQGLGLRAQAIVQKRMIL